MYKKIYHDVEHLTSMIFKRQLDIINKALKNVEIINDSSKPLNNKLLSRCIEIECLIKSNIYDQTPTIISLNNLSPSETDLKDFNIYQANYINHINKICENALTETKRFYTIKSIMPYKMLLLGDFYRKQYHEHYIERLVILKELNSKYLKTKLIKLQYTSNLVDLIYTEKVIEYILKSRFFSRNSDKKIEKLFLIVLKEIKYQKKQIEKLDKKYSVN